MVVENQSREEDKRTEARARQQRTLRAMGDFFQGRQATNRPKPTQPAAGLFTKDHHTGAAQA